ncbi:GvpL/GvpF family gas vesicle protein [Microtetraspora sp. NBRC 16547]|uniref:GvpL/GvpF family gas vesicle protein n=1 Tax=Microtetraspora sp. NBRC 16547 TaxID=3030993 RepID=UPI00249FC915|nr:GvpL/GvpF family gas vesicle protein [Microtetraspora sp. NBRC 16547]GLW98685.1 gas vesicle protein [Microtetraspora sp. NBRC 16547]
MGDVGTYLYAVAGDAGRRPPGGLTGVGGAPVRVIADCGLAAYVSTVPLDEFGEESLRRSMEDPDWLGETARAHHGVVAAVAETGPTAPVRLVTVYSGDEQVRDLLRRRAADFAEALSHVSGRSEWGVKVYVDPAALSAALSPAATGDEAADRGERIHTALLDLAVTGRRHRAQDPRLSGRDEWMVLNGAYLVDEDRGPEFAAAVAKFREPGTDVDLSGPWPPYSFTELADTGLDDTGLDDTGLDDTGLENTGPADGPRSR